MPRTEVRSSVRRALTPALASVLALAAVSVAPLPRPLDARLAAGPAATPAGEVFVVTANLQEAFNRSDYRNLKEMGVFVKRLLDKVPQRPDALLLQDVRKSAVRRVVELLTKKTGDQYRVAQRLRKEPWQKLPDNVWYSTETAIVVNTVTMEIDGKAGFVRIRNPWGNPKGDYVEYKGQAYARVVERDSGDVYGLMSVHLPKEPSEANKYAKRFGPWVDRLATFMTNHYPTGTRVIGGDFNQTRCLGKDPCKEAPFWKVLTSAEHGYIDALWTEMEPRHYTDRLPLGVDLIFTTGGMKNAGGDVKNPPVFYSDHRFFWANLIL